MEATIDTNTDMNVIVDLFKKFDLKNQNYLLTLFTNIVKTETNKAKRTFEDVEKDLWNGQPVACEEAVEFLSHYEENDPLRPYTKEELIQDVQNSEKEIANGEITDDEEVERCFNALMESL